MTDAAAGRRALLRSEGAIAIVVNAVLSIGFFLLVFGWREAPTQALAIDFLPQTFGVTFLGTLVPSFLTYDRIARGKVVPAGPVRSRGRHVLRILASALGAVVVLGGGAALLLSALAPPLLSPGVAMAIKAAYGSFVGAVMTPPILRMLLGMPAPAGRRLSPDHR